MTINFIHFKLQFIEEKKNFNDDKIIYNLVTTKIVK